VPGFSVGWLMRSSLAKVKVRPSHRSVMREPHASLS
jgi:hypothetical protein